MKKTFVLLLGLFLILFLTFYFIGRVSWIDRKGTHEALLLLNFDESSERQSSPTILLTSVERANPISTKERIVSEIKGGRALEMIGEIQKRYAEADGLVVQPSGSSNDSKIYMTLSCDGKWSVARIDRVGEKGEYVRFFADTVSSSFRNLKFESLPREIRDAFAVIHGGR